MPTVSGAIAWAKIEQCDRPHDHEPYPQPHSHSP
jgi:hypothetical protein